ncbi:MAG TPA: hypothetical protein VNS79_01995 [Sphingobium sp.]|nr:hypothetical protein [Sphingobium sp.]
MSLNQRARVILALCVMTAGCGEVPVEQANGIANATALAADNAVSTLDDDSLADRKPRKILSPDEKRRVARLLKIYRETRPDSSPDGVHGETSDDRDLVASALDQIDPRILQDERRREATLERQEFDKSVDDMISEHEKKRAANP